MRDIRDGGFQEILSILEILQSRQKKRLEVGFELLRDFGPEVDRDVARGGFAEAAAERRIVGEDWIA